MPFNFAFSKFQIIGLKVICSFSHVNLNLVKRLVASVVVTVTREFMKCNEFRFFHALNRNPNKVAKNRNSTLIIREEKLCSQCV